MFVVIVYQATYGAIGGHRLGKPLQFGVSGQARCPDAEFAWDQKREEDYLAQLHKDGFLVERRSANDFYATRSKAVNEGRLVIMHTVRGWFNMPAGDDSCVIPPARCVAPSQQAPVKLPHWRWGTDTRFKTPTYK